MLRQTGGSPPALKARLSARRYLMLHGWTVEQINQARDAKEALCNRYP
jgi:hypothetical protein